MAFLEKLTIDLDPIRTSREFRYLFTARGVSLLGLGFLIVAVPVQVYQLTGSTAQVAAVTAVLGITTFAATFVGGVLADRFDRRNVIAIARGTAAVAFALLAVNAYLPEPQMWAIYLISVVDGAAGGISATALMAVTPSLVPRDKLAAAGALMALTADLGSMVGPALGGVVIAAGGVGLAYALAAFTTVITTFCITRLPPLPPATVSVESPLRSIAAGFTYAFRNRVIGQVLVVGFAAMLLTGWAVLLPAFADGRPQGSREIRDHRIHSQCQDRGGMRRRVDRVHPQPQPGVAHGGGAVVGQEQVIGDDALEPRIQSGNVPGIRIGVDKLPRRQSPPGQGTDGGRVEGTDGHLPVFAQPHPVLMVRQHRGKLAFNAG